MAYLTSFLEAFFQIISGLIFQVWNFLRVESCCMNTIHFYLLFCIYHMDSFSLSSEMIIATTIINLQNRFWSSTHPPVFGFWLLGCESRDFSQRDKQKKTACKLSKFTKWQIFSLMSGSCHLDRASRVEIGQIYVIVIFLTAAKFYNLGQIQGILRVSKLKRDHS